MLLRLDSHQSVTSFRRICIEVFQIYDSLVSLSTYYSPCNYTYRYGLPVNFQAMLLHPNKKNTKKLRDVLQQLYGHLDSSAQSGTQGSHDVCILMKIISYFKICHNWFWQNRKKGRLKFWNTSFFFSECGYTRSGIRSVGLLSICVLQNKYRHDGF